MEAKYTKLIESGLLKLFCKGINKKIRVIQRMAYGYKDFEYFRLKVIQQFSFRDVQSIFDG